MDVSSDLDLSKGCVVLDFSTMDAERRNADALLSHLQRENIPLAAENVLRPNCLKEVNTLLPAEFSVLILFAHGRESMSDGVPDLVGHPESIPHHNPGPGSRGHWFNVVTMLPENSDVVVLLAVCDGYCKDSEYTLCLNTGYAAVLVGPTEPITGGEAYNAYSTLLTELYRTCDSTMGLDISRVAEAFPRANTLASRKLAMYPSSGA
jgi:hypothetical protein